MTHNLQIVPPTGGGSALAAGLHAEEKLSRLVHNFLTLSDKVSDTAPSRCTASDKAAYEELVSSGQLAQLATDLIRACQPATPQQIIGCIGVMLMAVPSGQKEDRNAYTDILLEEVLTAEPSWYVIERACRVLRRISTFRPSICEVYTELESAEKHLAYILRRLIEGLQKHTPDDDNIRELRAIREPLVKGQPRWKELLPTQEKRSDGFFKDAHGVVWKPPGSW
jgi:hypothetical protein